MSNLCGKKEGSFVCKSDIKMARKCSGWQNRMLTKGGKAVLIKFVLQSMPVHLFSAMNPPKTVIKKVEKILTDFFWGMVEGKAKYHWGILNVIG